STLLRRVVNDTSNLRPAPAAGRVSPASPRAREAPHRRDAMKHLLGLALASLLAAPATAADEPKKATTFEVEVKRDVAYSADKERHILDLYLPKGKKDFPVLFFIHGGGWRNGNKKGSGRHGMAFAQQGIGFVTINYRLSPKVRHPSHIEDVARAFAWVTKNI